MDLYRFSITFGPSTSWASESLRNVKKQMLISRVTDRSPAKNFFFFILTGLNPAYSDQDFRHTPSDRVDDDKTVDKANYRLFPY